MSEYYRTAYRQAVLIFRDSSGPQCLLYQNASTALVQVHSMHYYLEGWPKLCDHLEAHTLKDLSSLCYD